MAEQRSSKQRKVDEHTGHTKSIYVPHNDQGLSTALTPYVHKAISQVTSIRTSPALETFARTAAAQWRNSPNESALTSTERFSKTAPTCVGCTESANLLQASSASAWPSSRSGPARLARPISSHSSTARAARVPYARAVPISQQSGPFDSRQSSVAQNQGAPPQVSLRVCPGCGRTDGTARARWSCASLCYDCLRVLQPVPTNTPSALLANIDTTRPLPLGALEKAKSSKQREKAVKELETSSAPSFVQRLCEYEGCTRTAASGGLPYCAGHGGGRKCEAPGCGKIARAGGPPFCKAHGGGRRCQQASCGKSAASGGSPFCAAHGGGRRCEHPDCQKSARAGGPAFCAAHGGGKRCEFEGCHKSARAGGANFCAAHGGGRRCAFKTCRKSAASGGQPFCIAHGGGRRCAAPKCVKSAASGGQPFCIAHGGGRRCEFRSCDKSAVPGGPPFCIAHGGGRRCEHPGCSKSAESGGLPLCIAHGGGKRCEMPGCTKAARNGAIAFCKFHGGGDQLHLTQSSDSWPASDADDDEEDDEEDGEEDEDFHGD